MFSDSQNPKDKSKSKPDEFKVHQGRDNVFQLTGQMQKEDAMTQSNTQESSKQHLVLAGVEQEMDTYIARSAAERASRIQGRKLTRNDRLIVKGDAGEGRTRVALLDRYERERIVEQPRFVQDTGEVINPDFAVRRDLQSDEFIEVVDAKAWSLLRPKDADGNPMSREEFLRYLSQKPEAKKLLHTSNLQGVVERYASITQLASDGKVVLYFPGDVMRYAPQIKQEIESWSGSTIAKGRIVEVRSMKVTNEDLWGDAAQRYKRS